MPQVRDPKLVDGFYKNASKDADGNDAPWSAATLSFRPGQVRFVSAAARAQSRSVNRAFELALANGRLAGPFATAEEAAGGSSKPAPVPAPAPEPEPEAVEEPPAAAPEPEPAPAEEAPEEPAAAEDEPSSKTKRRRRRRNSGGGDDG